MSVVSDVVVCPKPVASAAAAAAAAAVAAMVVDWVASMAAGMVACALVQYLCIQLEYHDPDSKVLLDVPLVTVLYQRLLGPTRYHHDWDWPGQQALTTSESSLDGKWLLDDDPISKRGHLFGC